MTLLLLHFHSPCVGIDNVDYGRYPDEVLQKKWLRMYLQEAAKLRGTRYIYMKLNILLVMSLLLFLGEEGSVMSIPDEEVHQLYRIVNKFALVSYKIRGNNNNNYYC